VNWRRVVGAIDDSSQREGRMPAEREVGYQLLIKPTGGLWLLFTDQTMVDIDMSPAEMRSFANDLVEQAARVEKMPRGVSSYAGRAQP
jgi:hypothetical protein